MEDNLHLRLLSTHPPSSGLIQTLSHVCVLAILSAGNSCLTRSNRKITNNHIRGPQSALTDFLASNNISATQIARDYERRQAESGRRTVQERSAPDEAHEDSPDVSNDRLMTEPVLRGKKQGRVHGNGTAEFKLSKSTKNKKKRKSEKSDDEDTSWVMHTRKQPLPGQLENCENCAKRFTVSAYSGTGQEGGLLCPKCSKVHELSKKGEKVKKERKARDKRRQTQSTLLDGIVQIGTKTLQELCIGVVAKNINEIDEFGDLPDSLLKQLSQILSRRRVMNSRTLGLFLRPDLETIDIYDCGKLETEDYIRLIATVSRLQNINLRNAGQFKDEVLEYMIERHTPIKQLKLDAANLVSNTMWLKFFKTTGSRLETLKLSWLDSSMDDETFACTERYCTRLKSLKLIKCFRLGDAALTTMAELTQLQHLSLHMKQPISSESLVRLISSIGANLRTLSLRNFTDADDTVLAAIRVSCCRLAKFRFTDNDYCNDVGFADLFLGWSNPPLSSVDLSSNRSTDYSAPDGPQHAVGLASEGFQALMRHSGSSLERLDVSSCRHIHQQAFLATFTDGSKYPLLRDLNISFLNNIDTPLLASIFRTCPKLAKVTAFGCFNVADVVVPEGIALIGVPNAQDTIIQEGSLTAD